MIRKTIIVVLTLAAVATAALWPASYIVSIKEAEAAGLYMHGFIIGIPLHDGLFTCFLSEGEISAILSGPIESTRHVRERNGGFAGFHLIVHARTSQQYGRHLHRSLTIPFWFPLILFAAYPAVAFIRGSLRRRYRRNHGLCPHCGYNLTGNVTGICSECGKPPAP